ncbi:aldehyde dehydrogenase family protein [Leucobacter komagatae]|uniref:Aldehyde dehydrogenase n=1 Tax=Leucobacter komagatae TaxID=55969 RepID=A0A0D0IKB4_9MICO|nr:aldehyde dehydrogenase family protein [Leucobacter komagatae]KIP51502.1 aldehyde dehydrogenase [Leucobacter komagatae]
MTLKNVRNYIDGSWVEGAGTFTVVNPASRAQLAAVAASTADHVDGAVSAAHAAFATWRFTTVFQRATMLRSIADVVERREDELLLAITQEMGKTLGESRGEVQKLAQAFRYYAAEGERVVGRVVPNEASSITSLVTYEPVGVVAAITPWNYPLELIGWKLCAALAAGATIVVKPSEFSTLSAALLFECMDEAGLPAGVANLVFGRGIGPDLVGHPLVSKIAFTGSTATGNQIARSVHHAIPLSMELGGTCPMVVTEHADLQKAVSAAARRGFRNAGQICIAINRIYVHSSLYEEFLSRLAVAVDALVIGDGTEDGVDMGPLATEEGLAKARRHVDDALAHGARIVSARRDVPASGSFMCPAVLADCTPDMLVMNEETFGPVVGVSAFDSIDDALELANRPDSGLAAYAFTESLAEAHLLSARLDYGNVAINNPDPGIMNAPYGGRKGSGFGYEHGPEGLLGYLEIKHTRIAHALPGA